MSYLVDSHTILWALMAPGKLTASGRQILSDSNNEIFVSHVSFWEISLKYSLGKLDLKNLTPEDFPKECLRHGFSHMGLTINDACSFHQLPPALHKDPFDRMLAWQAITHKLSFLSKDRNINVYETFGLKVVW